MVPVAIQGSEDFHKEKTDCAADSRAPAPRCPSPEESNVTGLVRCSPMKCDLLKVMLPDLQSSLPNCSLKIVTEGIELHSVSGSVKEAKLKICEQVYNFDSHAISDMDSQRAKLLMSDGGQQQVQKLFSKAGIQAVLSVTDGQLWLIATDSSKILEKSLHSFEIPVEDFHQEYLQSAECKQFIEDLEHNYTVLVEKRKSKLVIEALGDCTEEIQKQIHDILEAHAQCTEEIHLKVEDWELLNAHHKETVEALGCADGTRSTQVTLTTLPSREGVIQVSGHTKLLQDVKTAVKNLVGRITHKTISFSIPGLFKFMDEGSGSMMIRGIQLRSSLIFVTEEKDTAEIGGEMDEAIETKIVAEHCKEREVETVTLAESYTETKETEREPKVTLEVKRGDLTQFTADVLVNTPASKDKDLAKCGQVCRAFCKVGGEQMQKKLEGQIYRCLQKASELQADSIAFPTVGCGKLRYDPSAVGQCFKRAVKKHASNETCCISKVIVIAFDGQIYQDFVKILDAPCPRPLISAKERRLPGYRHHRPTTPTSSVKGRIFPHGQSITVFHISAQGQACIDEAVSAINKSVNEYSAGENVLAEYVAKFSQRDIDDMTVKTCRSS
ncbi:hypothetical protein LSAT2_008351 [Lamellibrachia satsuma]|nr:hypothetical protein LSAT2_008351 [Lamellibrachia satsuma]